MKKVTVINKISHYEETVQVPTTVFAYANGFTYFSGHMNMSNMMMDGGSRATKLDSGRGKVSDFPKQA